MIEINRNPSPRELVVFGLLWLLFFGVVGSLARWNPSALLGAAAFTGAAWLVGMIFNRDDRASQSLGGLLPLVFGAAGMTGAIRAAWTIGALGALLIWLAPSVGRRVYVGWMLAAGPIGWTVTRVILGVVYFIVLMPIGLAMRLLGRDPMQRRFDPSAATYWVERKPRETASYFRQF